MYVLQATMVMETVCLIFYIVRVIHSGYFSVPQVFWKDTKNIMVISIIAVSTNNWTLLLGNKKSVCVYVCVCLFRARAQVNSYYPAGARRLNHIALTLMQRHLRCFDVVYASCARWSWFYVYIGQWCCLLKFYLELFEKKQQKNM